MPSQVEDLLVKCETAIQSRKFEDAITGCRAVLNLAPDNVRAKELLDEAQSKLEADLFVRENLRKAQDAFQNRDFQKSINECHKIQLLDPDNPSVKELLTKAQEKLEAEPFILNFVTSGQSLYDSGLFSEAIAQWEKVRSIDPVYPGLDGMIGDARARMGGGQAGAPASMFQLGDDSSGPDLDLNFSPEPAKEQEPDFFGGFGGQESDSDKIARLLRDGDNLLHAGQHQQAIDVWSEIFMLDVSNTDALERIEAARSAMAEQPQGAAPVEEAMAEEGSLEDLLAKGSAAESSGQYREAAQFFSQALTIDADNADLADKIKNLNLLAKKQDRGKTVLGNARAFMEEGKMESARHALSKILEADPENEEALEMMRELKGKPGSGQPAEMESRAAAAPAERKPFPLIPAIVAAVLVVGGAGVYFMMSKSKGDAQSVNIAPVDKKTVKKSGNQTPNSTQTAQAANVTPEMKDAARKATLEAQFYFQEKHYPEALQRAEDALKIDPGNQQAAGLKAEATRRIKDAEAAEKKLLVDANNYFQYSEFVGAVKLYEQYLQRHPEAVNEVQPQVIKCYYNLGVISLRQWKCDTGSDYFQQVLFIDQNDKLSKDGLALARRCQQVGTSDLEIRKQITFLEMRK